MIARRLKRAKKTRKLVAIAFLIIAILLILTLLEKTSITHFFSSPDAQTSDPKKEAETNSTNKQDFIESNPKNTDTNSTIVEPTTDDISLSTRRETDGSVTILTELQNYSDGTCDLMIQNGTETYTKNASILYQPNFSTCAGFSVPENTVGFGTWQITLTVTSKGNVSTKSTTMEVQ